jgi:hypothetical protein
VNQRVAPGNDIDDTITLFVKQIATLSGDPKDESIRGYLAEMLAWI